MHRDMLFVTHGRVFRLRRLCWQVVGLQDAAGRCARMLCTIYLISIVPVSILLTIFISALKLV